MSADDWLLYTCRPFPLPETSGLAPATFSFLLNLFLSFSYPPLSRSHLRDALLYIVQCSQHYLSFQNHPSLHFVITMLIGNKSSKSCAFFFLSDKSITTLMSRPDLIQFSMKHGCTFINTVHCTWFWLPSAWVSLARQHVLCLSFLPAKIGKYVQNCSTFDLCHHCSCNFCN